MLLRIASMLTKLIAFFDSFSSPPLSTVVREESPAEEFDDEEEDENANVHSSHGSTKHDSQIARTAAQR